LFEHQEDSAQREIEYLRRQSEEYFREVSSLKERLQDIEASVEDMEKIINDREKTITGLETTIRELNEAKAQEEELRRRLEREIKDSRVLWKNELEAVSSELVRKNEEIDKHAQRFNDFKERSAILESEYKNIIDLKSLNERRLEEQAASLRDNFEIFKHQQENFKKTSEEQVDLVNQKFREVQRGYAGKIEQLNAQIERLQETFEQQVELKNAEIDQLKMNLEHYENYARSQQEAITLRDEQISTSSKRIM
jgi:chromosome segregation ATPase